MRNAKVFNEHMSLLHTRPVEEHDTVLINDDSTPSSAAPRMSQNCIGAVAIHSNQTPLEIQTSAKCMKKAFVTAGGKFCFDISLTLCMVSFL